MVLKGIIAQLGWCGSRLQIPCDSSSLLFSCKGSNRVVIVSRVPAVSAGKVVLSGCKEMLLTCMILGKVFSFSLVF